MKRLIAFAVLCLPIYLLSQGFGDLKTDQPYLAADRSSGVVVPTASFYAWYDAALLLTNDSTSASPPANNDRLGTWGAYKGNVTNLVGQRGSGGLTTPLYLATGSNTNGPAIRNTALFSSWSQFARNLNEWSGGSPIAQPITFFMVFKKNQANPNGGDGVMRSEANLNLYIKSSNINNNLIMFAGSTLTGPSSSILLSTWYLVTAQFNGASSFIRTNGVLYASGDVGTSGISGLSVGNYDSVEYLIGDYTDVVFYNRALDTNELQVVEQILKTKNGL